MPRQKRWFLKRHLDEALTDIANAQEHIVLVMAMIKEQHPEQGEALDMAGRGLGLAAKLLEQYRDEAI